MIETFENKTIHRNWGVCRVTLHHVMPGTFSTFFLIKDTELAKPATNLFIGSILLFWQIIYVNLISRLCVHDCSDHRFINYLPKARDNPVIRWNDTYISLLKTRASSIVFPRVPLYTSLFHLITSLCLCHRKMSHLFD